MALRDCIDDIRAAAGRPLSDEEVLQILDAVERRRQQRRAAHGLEGLDAATVNAARELGDEARLAALIEKRNRLIDLARKQERLGRYAEAGPGGEAAALSAMNVGAEGPAAGLAVSVDAEAQGLRASLLGPLVGELRRAGLLTVARAGNAHFDRNVARELWRLSDAAAPASGDARAAEIAGILGKYQEMARTLQNEAGAFIRKLPGWIVRQSHDSWRLAHAAGGNFRRGGTDADFRAWRDWIEPRLAARTFAEQDLDPANPAAREAFLRQAYVNLVSGNHMKAVGGESWLGGFRGPGNLAKKASQERVLHFKSADDWFDYHQRFGKAGLLEAVFGGLANAARNTALMRTWGTNPEAAFSADLDGLRMQARDRGDFQTHDKLGGWRIRAEFDALTGAAEVPGSPTLAMVSRTIRMVESLAKLGGVVLSSLPDIVTRAASLRHHGVGLLEGYRDGLTSLLRGRGKGAEREIADYIGVGIDGALGHMLAQFNVLDGVPGRMTKLMDIFFRVNLLSWWTDSLKTGVGLMLSRNLARHAGEAFDALPEGLRRSLGRHGIEAERWDALRGSAVRDVDGTAYLTGDGIQDAELAQALRRYFVDTVNEAMTVGGARERAWSTFGTRAGTPMGEAVRFVMQFKAFPIAFLSRHVRREVGRTGAIDGVGITNLIVGATVFGYLAMTAKDLAKGRTPRDPTDPATWGAAMQQGGGLGIYGDFLFGQYNRFGGGGFETLLGPTVGSAGQLVRIFGGLREGDGQAAETVRFAIGHTPLVNLFYTRLALDYLVLWHVQEWASPGWARRFERRVEKENNQRFYLSPAETVR